MPYLFTNFCDFGWKKVSTCMNIVQSVYVLILTCIAGPLSCENSQWKMMTWYCTGGCCSKSVIILCRYLFSAFWNKCISEWIYIYHCFKLKTQCWFFLLSNKVEHVEIVSKNVISTFEKYLKKYYDGEIEISAFLTYSS
jgi:hypothetical protein